MERTCCAEPPSRAHRLTVIKILMSLGVGVEHRQGVFCISKHIDYSFVVVVDLSAGNAVLSAWDV